MDGPHLTKLLPLAQFEQMAHDHWWMGLEAGGKYFHLNFGIQGRRQPGEADSKSRCVGCILPWALTECGG